MAGTECLYSSALMTRSQGKSMNKYVLGELKEEWQWSFLELIEVSVCGAQQGRSGYGRIKQLNNKRTDVILGSKNSVLLFLISNSRPYDSFVKNT